MKNKHKTIAEREKEAFSQMKEAFKYKNVTQAPKLVKVVLSSGTGSQIKKDKKKNDLIIDRLTRISGQKAVGRPAKKSIATFKSRQGEIIGVMVTLRGRRMKLFLERLINVALPRTKDFKGINRSAVDSMGNLNMGIKEHNIFPETAGEDLKDVFGLVITCVSTADNKKEATVFFENLGFPFKKE